MKHTGKAVLFYIGAIFFLLETACSPAAQEVVSSTPEPTAVVTASPAPEVISLEMSATPVPALPTISPTPLPTPTPEPTPEPDPWVDGMERTQYRDGFFFVELNDALKNRITGLSYPSDVASCLVAYDQLRYLRILYVDFDGNTCVGELIVNHQLALEVLEIFAELYDAAYPIRSVRLVDDFGEVADDNLSMAADNTSSFCYRKVTGSKKLSRHSYGAAIDINPLENPYVKKDGSVSPPEGKQYQNRKRSFPGKIDHEDLCYQVFHAHGWEWGGDFKNEKDYQHFSKEVK